MASNVENANNLLCCLIDSGERCKNLAGTASYSRRIQKTVSERKLKLSGAEDVSYLRYSFQWNSLLTTIHFWISLRQITIIFVIFIKLGSNVQGPNANGKTQMMSIPTTTSYKKLTYTSYSYKLYGVIRNITRYQLVRIWTKLS